MQIFIDIDTLVVTPTPLQACRGDRFPIELRFQKNATAIELPARTVGRVVFKLAGDFSGDFVIRAPWRRFGRSAGAFYLFNINFDHPSLDDLFVTLGGEVATVDLVMEFEWERGGARQSSRIVPIKIFNDYSRRDPLPPVIAINGLNPVTVSLGGGFVDLGATVTDDSDNSRIIMGTGSVDTSKTGSYTLTYRAYDVSGNEGIPVTRIVNVVDMTAPVITLIGANVINLVVGATFTDPGANVTDNLDAARVISGVGPVNTTLPGTYTLTYSAADAAGNVATPVTRSVIVSDVVAPVIALIGANPLIVPLNSVFVDPGANVTDDVSFVGVGHQVFGTGTAVNTAILGTYTLTYSATDAAGNAATPVTRSVIVSDVVAPVIALIGANPVNLNVGDVFTDAGANVTDDVDAAKVISGVGPVNAALPGTYTLTYSATDAAGNVATSVTRSVIVSDVVAPMIALIGTDPVNLNVGDVFTDDGANVTDDVDAARVISGTVLSPTLVFKGSYDNGYAYAYNDAVLYYGKFYYRHSNPSNPGYPPDPSVTANASWTMVTDIVDTGVAGTYVLTYAATDAAGNAATPVTRSVIVS